MKKILFTCLFLVLITYSFLFPELTVNAAKNGIQIWFNQILPALLPFTILSTILIKSNFLKSFKGNENMIAIGLTMCCGFVFGFPIGAKLSADFYKQNLLTEKQATLLAIATNNFSPMYVCGFALPLIFSSTDYNTITYILLYLFPLFLVTCILIACFFRIPQGNQSVDSFHTSVSSTEKLYANSSLENSPRKELLSLGKNPASPFHLNMQVMDAGIMSGFESLIKICGYIVLFSIITQILTNLWQNPPAFWSFLLGNMEITNGIQLLSQWHISEKLKYILIVQFLSLGGLSGMAQTGSILANSGLSTYKYIIGKVILSLLLTLLSVMYVFLFV